MRESDFSTLEWMRAARGYEVKIVSRDGAVTKFAGFKESVSGYDIYNVRYVIDRRGFDSLLWEYIKISLTFKYIILL